MRFFHTQQLSNMLNFEALVSIKQLRLAVIQLGLGGCKIKQIQIANGSVNIKLETGYGENQFDAEQLEHNGKHYRQLTLNDCNVYWEDEDHE